MTRAREIASQGGLVLISSTPFTTASTISLNNIFSSAYQNYKMHFTLTAASDTGFANFKFTSSGTVSSLSQYRQAMVGYGAGGSTSNYNANGAAQGYLLDWFSGYVNPSYSEVTVYNPNVSSSTSYSVHLGWSAFTMRTGGGSYFDNQVFDGMQITTSTGTITGTVKIYGIRN